MLILSALLSACATYEYHETRNIKPIRLNQAEAELIQEDALLDVGIVLFDPGVDIFDEESAAYSNVRESEAVWYASQLKTALEYSKAWGLVRTVPNENSIMDLLVLGTIVESNGETIELELSVKDAAGKLWFAKGYSERASAYAYNPEVDFGRDPFQSLFNQISNDLLTHRASMSTEELVQIRNVGKIRFAREFAPDVFSDFVVEDEEGIYSLQRIPAENDPMMLRIDQIQARNDLFLDVVQDYYRVFNKNMAMPYEEWRKLSYKDVVYARQLSKQARQEKIAGVAIMVSGALASRSRSRTNRVGGYVGMAAGASLFRKGFTTQMESSLHAESLRELGESLELELEPSIIELQDRTVTLSGTVEDQFKEWKLILKKMFETGQSSTEPVPNSAPEPEDAALEKTENNAAQLAQSDDNKTQ